MRLSLATAITLLTTLKSGWEEAVAGQRKKIALGVLDAYNH